MILSGLLREDTFAASKVLKFSTESPFIRINQSCKIFDYIENPNGLFNEMDERDLVSWSALISCYEQNEMHEEALVMFKAMTGEGIVMDEVVFLLLVLTCQLLK
ncbi:hypothetical protein Tsubulata_029483 [Turnera subulata]|uniref:Pentatricopeptide repeat-containing protein n=1 Tax=Turnera subulata TaxID=218843 RepID=A0A9Q0GD42_9ROSI|nr:hypothetical protein Tsubulata_029483 [Turnera subulata]